MAGAGYVYGETLRSIVPDDVFGKRIALIVPNPSANHAPGVTLTYAQLAQAVTEAADTLAAAGVARGSVVSMSLVNGVEFVVSFLAVTWLGAAAAPLNPAYTAEENQFYLEDTRTTHLILPAGAHSQPLARQAAALAGPCAPDNAIRLWEAQWVAGAKQSGGHLKLVPSPAASAAGGGAGPIVRTLTHGGAGLAAAASDVALILHTSGTTSRPKAVPLSHTNLCASARNIAATYALTPDDRTLLVMPLFHVHGLVGALLASLRAGAGVVVPPKFSASSFWAEFVACDCSWYSAVPTIHQILLQHEAKTDPAAMAAAEAAIKAAPPLAQGEGLRVLPATHSAVARRGRLRFVRSCSSALAPATWQQLEALLGVPVVEAYAMTEAAHQMTSNELPGARDSTRDATATGARKPGSVGRAQGGTRMAILDDSGKEVPRGVEAEICIRGVNVTSGYLNNPSANAVSFHPHVPTPEDAKLLAAAAKQPAAVLPLGTVWFRTGDQGFMDADGFVYLTGRLKELINRGGEKIAPLELDAVLLEHAAVAEAIAFGAPDAMYGQAVHAAVVLKPGQTPSPALAQAIQAFCKTRLAAFKVPVVLHFADAVPRTATGKIQRRFVAAHFLERATAASGAKVQSKL